VSETHHTPENAPAPDNHPNPTPLAFRIGHGYDLHRLEPLAPAGPGRPLILGGVRVDHNRGPVAHSDGDALLHAVTDALLGAIGEPDIGQLFPNDDPRNDAEDSAVFLAEATKRVAAAGYTVANLDATVILERPKLSPHKDALRANIARLLGLPLDRINVKGKTHEKVDAVGEGRAVEVHAVVLLTRAATRY
jgi:2-C-methyl-D-erythritol 2,4-cyclodiphosphate synthase